MPFGDMHRTQKRKNVVLLIALLLLMGTMFALTLIKFHP